jgi:hypothetical protein
MLPRRHEAGGSAADAGRRTQCVYTLLDITVYNTGLNCVAPRVERGPERAKLFIVYLSIQDVLHCAVMAMNIVAAAMSIDWTEKPRMCPTNARLQAPVANVACRHQLVHACTLWH